MQRKIVTICLHPSIDRVLRLTAPLEAHGLNRAEAAALEKAGGKGINVAGVLQALTKPVLALSVRAGFNGQRLLQLLERQGHEFFLLELSGETRECLCILDDAAHPTEINELGPNIEAKHLEALSARIPADTARVIVSGSLPPGLEAAAFGAWLTALARQWTVIVDSSGLGLQLALEAGVNMVKPNRAELQALALSSNDVWQRYGVRVLCSLGADGLHYQHANAIWQQAALPVKVLNPVGAGDAALAGFVAAELDGLPTPDCLALAVACATAACQEMQAGVVKREKIENFLAQIVPAQAIPEVSRG